MRTDFDDAEWRLLTIKRDHSRNKTITMRPLASSKCLNVFCFNIKIINLKFNLNISGQQTALLCRACNLVKEKSQSALIRFL